MEVGHDVVGLHVLADQADLAVGLRLVAAVQVGQRHLEHTALEALRGDFWAAEGKGGGGKEKEGKKKREFFFLVFNFFLRRRNINIGRESVERLV